MELLLTRRKDEFFATIAARERFVVVTHTCFSPEFYLPIVLLIWDEYAPGSMLWQFTRPMPNHPAQSG
jgi:hypothetical protein